MLLIDQMRNFACNASCVCVCVCEGNRVTSQQSVQPVKNCLNRGLCPANTYEHYHCVCQATLFPFRAWTDKTNLKAEARDYGKGRYIVLVMFGQSQCIGSVGQSEQTALVGRRGFVENNAFERGGHRGITIMYSIWKIMCFLNIKACQHILLHQIHKVNVFKIASYDSFNKTWLSMQ